MSRRCLFSLLMALLPALALAKPLSRVESERQTRVVAQLKQSVAAAKSDADRFALIGGVWSAERDVGMRRRVLEIVAAIPGDAQEAFLTGLLASEEDAGLRSEVATALGKTGSEKCLAALAKTAASDRTTMLTIGDIGSQGSARRAAIFAIAELAQRFPKLADKAADELRALPDKLDPKDNESLGDARRQALYQITLDEALLKPFFDRLASADARERERGVIAFRFLKLKQAPPQVVQAMHDTSPDVCSWAALVLGEIGDPMAVEPLLAAATDPNSPRLVRVNAIGSLGRMRAKPAAEALEKLLADPAVATNAAIALYRITGKKTKEFPEGYNAD